jgi:hypothetical protein
LGEAFGVAVPAVRADAEFSLCVAVATSDERRT